MDTTTRFSIKLEPHPIYKDTYRVLYYNGVYMGDVSRAHDLNYNFWPETNGGFWSQDVLFELAKKLKELNDPIDAEFNAWCESHPPTTTDDIGF